METQSFKCGLSSKFTYGKHDVEQYVLPATLRPGKRKSRDCVHSSVCVCVCVCVDV